MLAPTSLGSLGGELGPLARGERGGSGLPALEAAKTPEGDGGGVLLAFGLVLALRGLAGGFADDLEGDLTEVTLALPRHGRSIARVTEKSG